MLIMLLRISVSSGESRKLTAGHAFLDYRLKITLPASQGNLRKSPWKCHAGMHRFYPYPNGCKPQTTWSGSSQKRARAKCPPSPTLLNSLCLLAMGAEASTGGMTSFNVDYGAEEALVRGFKSGFINAPQYAALMDYKEGSR